MLFPHHKLKDVTDYMQQPDHPQPALAFKPKVSASPAVERVNSGLYPCLQLQEKQQCQGVSVGSNPAKKISFSGLNTHPNFRGLMGGAGGRW